MSTPVVYVGRVPFSEVEDTDGRYIHCALCKARLLRENAARHARARHKSLYEGVLPGQLGLPFTGTPDVPR